MQSLWTETQPLPKFPHQQKDIKTDVLIIGGGMAGILTARELERAGVDYLLIEAKRICGGTTGNTTAKITSQHGLCYHKLLKSLGTEKARMYYSANEAALSKYRELSQTIPCDFETRNSYIYSLKDRNKLFQELSALNTLKIRAESAVDLSLPFPTAGAIEFKNQAQFHPLKFVAGIVPGLRIFEHTEAQGFEGNLVYTNHGRILAETIVIATHFPILNKHGSYFLKMHQNRSYVCALENAQDVNGMYLDESGTGLSLRNYGNFLLLGGGSHRTGKQGGAWSFLEDAAKRYYPAAAIQYRWAAQDCMTLDTVPYVGRYSKNTHRLFTATGFNKWGMSGSMAAAMTLNDLIQGRPSPYAELFCPSRSVLHPQLAVNTLEAALNLLTPTRPRCPHMGCALKWNRHEHSWDCPCHGSRFTREGKLLDNPATGDLKNNGDC